jgi:hypothetical protein
MLCVSPEGAKNYYWLRLGEEWDAFAALINSIEKLCSIKRFYRKVLDIRALAGGMKSVCSCMEHKMQILMARHWQG